MRIRDTLHLASTAMKSRKGRSLLTMLGIIIGVGSVVLMTGIGEGMEGVILGQISTIGTRSMVIFPGSQHGPNAQFFTGFDSLTFQDVEAIKKLETIESMAPIIFVDSKSTYGREEVSHTVVGTLDNFFRNQSITAEQGRVIDSDDDRKARFVATLGPDTASDLFGGKNPVGKRINVASRTFEVVGVMESVGTQFFQNLDERIYIPLSVAKSMTGQKYVNYMTMQAVHGFDEAFRDVKSLLRTRHQIDNPDEDSEKDDFQVSSSEQANEILGAVSLGLTLFITLVAGISLLVGGIGIMNIMLVAVQERTREIGLRKALGARRRDILRQFLIEAIVLTLFGGIIGVVAGVGLVSLTALIVERYLDRYTFAISIPAVGLALGVAALTGIVFGMYPAIKASRLDPVEALRYE